MNAEELYRAIKDALQHFGLDFRDKEKMTVTFEFGQVWFHYEGRNVGFKIENP